MKATKEQLEFLRELFPFVKIVDENHRLGTIVDIDKTELKYNPRKYNYDWIYAGKRSPNHFTLVFAGIDKNCNLLVDNYCNIIEEGDLDYDRGECSIVITDKKEIVQIYDL